MTWLHLGHSGLSDSDCSHHPCLPQEFEERVGAAHMVQKTLQARAVPYSTTQGGSQKGSHPAEAWWPMGLNRGPHSSTGSDPTEKRIPSLQLLTVERDQYPQQLLNICKSWGLRGLEPSVTLVTVYKSSMRGREQFCRSVHPSCKWAQQLAPQESTRHRCHQHCAVPHSLASTLPTECCASAGQNKTFKISEYTNTGLCLPEANSQDKSGRLGVP